MPFPKGFIWGAAAAAYQVEGSAYRAGGGLSVWDMLARQPGRIYEGGHADVACDHYNRYKEDVGLMKELGLHSYRLSISWPRVLPEGVGKVHAEGLAFYDRLVDELLKNGIEPAVTLFHWDGPLALFHRGGWLNRDSADWFAEYAEVVLRKLGDRVKIWLTMNEPNIFIVLGHGNTIHGPGINYGTRETLLCAHNVMRAHGRGVQVIRAHARKDAQVGWAYAGAGFAEPETEADAPAARKALEQNGDSNPLNVLISLAAWWNDPVFFGRYPVVPQFKDMMEFVKPGDMETICQPLDFFGTNLYNSVTYRADASNPVGLVPVKRPMGYPHTAFNWPVTPGVLYWAPKFYYERYKKPICVLENGLSCADWVSLDGQVHDPNRIDFLNRYLLDYERAANEGIPLMGYYQWSIMDNFEWAEAYKERFGLIHVDYATQKRTPKDSYHWYKKVIATNGTHLHAHDRK